MKHSLWLLLVGAVLLPLGCGNSDQAAKPAGSPSTSTTSNAPETSKRTIGVSLLTLDNPFFKVIGDNITAEGKKRGYETIVVSGDKDAARQSNQIGRASC